MDSLKSVFNVCTRKPSLGAADFKPSLNQLYLYSTHYVGCQLEFTTSRLVTYNKRTNMIKESPLQVCH